MIILGLRDYERTNEKPPEVYQILVLRDVYMEVIQGLAQADLSA